MNLMLGNCLDKMKELEDNSVDSIVTDPPYGISFMNKKWDYDVPSIEIWEECLRVLKPGGHLLSFAGTRTQHRMAINIEDAGFEIRDMLAWIYGQGFPKSLNIEKQISKSINNIDKAIDNIKKEDIISIWKKYLKNVLTVEIQSKKNQIEVGSNIIKDFFVQNNAVVNHKIKKNKLLAIIAEINSLDQNRILDQIINIVQNNADTNIKQKKFNVKFVPKYLYDQFHSLENMSIARVNVMEYLNENIMNKIKEEEVQKILNGETLLLEKEIINVVCVIQMNELKHTILNQSKIFQNLDTIEQMDYVYATNVTIIPSIMEHLITNTVNILKIKEKIKGWGTALKPSLEPITLARKPIEEKTIVDNVLKYGTGGINIEESRIIPQNKDEYEKNCNRTSVKSHWGSNDSNKTVVASDKGRFPANLIHDGSEEIEQIFPYSKSGEMKSHHKNRNLDHLYGRFSDNYELLPIEESKGSASRFFYCAKTSKSERNAGVTGEAKQQDESRKEGNPGVHKSINHHPTVKPLKLMEYLVTLVTPKKGIILDPFMGSGTTGMAAKSNGFEFIGIELDPEYFEIAKQRIDNIEQKVSLF